MIEGKSRTEISDTVRQLDEMRGKKEDEKQVSSFIARLKETLTHNPVHSSNTRSDFYLATHLNDVYATDLYDRKELESGTV